MALSRRGSLIGVPALRAIVLVFFATLIGCGFFTRLSSEDSRPRVAGGLAVPAWPRLVEPNGGTGPRPGIGSYESVVARNIFSPDRSAGVKRVSPGTAVIGATPLLYGIILAGPVSIAYLEDPLTKRVTGYRVGDVIAGATVEAIGPDLVVLKGAGGTLHVSLRDPSKPGGEVTESGASEPVASSGSAGVTPASAGGVTPTSTLAAASIDALSRLAPTPRRQWDPFVDQ
jgi:hypothetical protein